MSLYSDITKWCKRVVLVLSKTFIKIKSFNISLLLLLITRLIWYFHYYLKLDIDNNLLSF